MTARSNYTAYISCRSGNEVNVFAGNDVSGNLTHIQTTSRRGGGRGLKGRGLSLTHSPDRRRLYASVYGDQDSAEKDVVDTYAVDQDTGRLTHVSSTPVMAQLIHISMDRRGRFLLGASEPSGLIAVYPIDEHGKVRPNPSYAKEPLSGAHQVLLDYSNKFAYVPSLSSDVLVSLVFDEKTGTFQANSPPQIALQSGAGCRHVAFHPGRRYLYLLNQRDGSLIVYEMEPMKGGLLEIMRASILPTGFEGSPWGAQVHASPDGQRLYASERRSNTLTVWDIDHVSGKLSNRHTVETAENPRCFDVTPNGRFILVSALKADCIELFDVSQSSTEPQKVLELPTGIEPGWVEII